MSQTPPAKPPKHKHTFGKPWLDDNGDKTAKCTGCDQQVWYLADDLFPPQTKG